MRLTAISLLAMLTLSAPAIAGGQLVDASLHVARGGQSNPNVALTFDACQGRVDDRILNTLIDERIPATIFVTERWLKRNSVAAAKLKANSDLFQIEDHGAHHVPAVDRPMSIFGLQSAGSPAAVAQEVHGGATAISSAGFGSPKWFRGATARYTASSIKQIEGMGFRVAGYSINGDQGASLSAAGTERRIAAAKDGDVVIAHINQPGKPAGDGVVRALKTLKARGVNFVHLDLTD